MFKQFVLPAFALPKTLLAALGVVAATAAHAQPAQTLSAPAECTKTATDWRTAQLAPALAAYRASTEANRAEFQARYLAANTAAAKGAQGMAAECAAKFSVQTIPAAQLNDFVALLTLAGNTAGVRAATDRLLSDGNLAPRTRAQGLLLGVNRSITDNASTFGILDDAEKYVAQIDLLPDSLADIKLQAHTKMLSRYEYLDVAAGLQNHAQAIIALEHFFPKDAVLISAYQSLARSFADRLQPDSALRVLDTGERELGPVAAASYADFRNRYALIGKHAPAIDAVWWINTEASKVNTPANGNVTLIEFTAHWCGPCKNSYPGLRSLAEKFKGQAFTGVMVTQLYGYLGTQKNLGPNEEIAADRNYFGTEHALPFPVAINAQIKQTGNAFVQPKPDTDYRVGGIPQIMIVDKHGIIRQIVTGWDQGNTARFSALIEKLLAEK